ncbi:sodium:proton antiporter [Pragia fontium]|uniref:Transporter, UIT6 family (TC 9.B.53) n=1 Tax=Pragia fontium DSM 5563 = ATCC 49100 TaxID=1122977 RepID=A0AAJ5BG06_9GAMM|nr:sodium:proton antiporter [Pragia fontium]AKJ41171.1 sodium:proton antiporter [Pragia fontium]SFC11356.1 transporter, UIT6 family (TC 9.B.53) [Pragia fontium DSM 5563 = ATCC 49100]SUB81380.1 Citrate transporter [Pragia fontium]VEJ53606.1 Citrate transporter [Pragia fontium]
MSHQSLLKLLCLFFGLLTPVVGFAADIDGSTLSLAWGIPFVGILLSIALCPLIIPTIWHHHFGKITALWSVLFLIPFTMTFGMDLSVGLVSHAMLAEYIPFIILLLSLFTVSGGILVKGNLHGSPKLNTALLAIGAVLASLMGTTGAAMLLIRPLIRANDNRKHRVHVIIFFIFLVANIGGGLTPLGDPPLFIGFLKGVDFFWTAQHMLLPVFICTAVLLVLFYLVDSYYYKREDELEPRDPTPDSKLRLYGKFNFILLLAIVGSVLLSGFWKPGIEITLLGVHMGLQDISRDVLLLVIAGLSMLFTAKQIRSANQFNWEPILEVGKLFAGIFITIGPVLAILRAGQEGHMAGLVAMVSDSQGAPINAMYFWLSGALSGFLDNAPTYLVFFNLAAGDAATLMGPLQQTLLAISMGSVFMGALTYIGNAPNFMVKSIATQSGIKMPSFFGYMKWSFGILIPLFLILTGIFFLV